MNEIKTVPAGVRRFLLGLVTVLAVSSAIGNVGHGFDFATKASQGKQDWFMGGVSALLPDALIVIGVFLWLYGDRWLGGLLGGSGVAFMVWAACSLETTSTARIVAAWPVYGAVLGAWALHVILTKKAPTPAVQEAPEAAPKPLQRRTPKRPAPAFPQEPAAPTILPADAPLTEPLAVLPETPKAVPVVDEPATATLPTRRRAPSREVAAEILAELDDLDSISAAELGRRHGGSDVFWLDRKREEADRRLTAELVHMGGTHRGEAVPDVTMGA